MTLKEIEGDTCKACKYNKPTIKTCDSCKQALPYSIPTPYCHKNGFWIAEVNPYGMPCQYFKREKIWYLGIFEINTGDEKEWRQ
jgi:hypothetical protein